VTFVRIGLKPTAKRQITAIRRWFRSRGRAAVFDAELDAVLAILAAHPEAGHVYGPMPGFRRILMERVQHYVYYRFEQSEGILWLAAVWSTTRGRPPRL
jgi:plasmid stabilization system protein ParE